MKVMWWTVAKEAAGNWSSHKDSRQGAALAYYSVFSLGPIIVIAIAVAGFFFGRDAVSGQVASSIRDMLGDTGAKAVEAMLADAGRPREVIVATLLGLAAVMFAAIGVVVRLKDALNTVWEVEETPGHGAWHFIRNYVVSLAAVLGWRLLGNAAPHMQEWFFHLATMSASVGVTSLLFAMMFKWLPDVVVDWYDVWLGAVITAVLFELGKSAIGFYIGKQGLESTYGAAASIIVLLIWVYYSSQIILMGAEVTHAFARHKGSLRHREPSARSPDLLKDSGAIGAS
jgi:membrane protein